MPRSAARDWTGNRIGRLTVISRGPNVAESGGRVLRATWLCRCDCGGEIVVRGQSLTKALAGKGGTRSCGCLAREKEQKHGMSATRTYRIWHMMRQRCGNPNSGSFRYYGGRGIRVCEKWTDFAAFFADMGEAPAGRSIDRIDNSKGYEPGNCQWATKRQQQNNMRSNVRISFGGRTLTIAEWSREIGVTKSCLITRLGRGLTIERALAAPSNKRKVN